MNHCSAKDIFDLAAYAAEKDFTVVFGTNGVLLREKQAKLMRQHGVVGASISLDSTEPARHDAFRHLPGAWDGAVRATKRYALRGSTSRYTCRSQTGMWQKSQR